MDQGKIGKFITQCRKRVNLTQIQLAEKLDVAEKTVVQWEVGKSVPQAAKIPLLCEVLNISINELFLGETVTTENENKDLERHLLEMVRQQELAEKRVRMLKLFASIAVTVVLTAVVFLCFFVQMADWLKCMFLFLGVVFTIFGCYVALGTEQRAGYYECKVCGHVYSPSYLLVNSPHWGKARHMRCPRCHKRTWQEKVE